MRNAKIWSRTVATILCLAGVAMLARTLYLAQSITLPAGVEDVSISINIGDFFDDSAAGSMEVPGLRESNTAGLFLIHDKVCPPCLGEIHEYLQLMRQFKPLIRPYCIILSENKEHGERLAKVSKLDVPYTVIGRNMMVGNMLSALERNGEVVRPRLYMIDTNRNLARLEVLLPTRMSTIEYKSFVLSLVSP